MINIKKGLAIFGGLIVCLLVIAAMIGSFIKIPIIEIRKKTTADKEAVWQLWSDVSKRASWDDGLEWVNINGSFVAGAAGELKLKGQPARKYKIIECETNKYYTDRFYLPLYGKMDWHHTINEITENEIEIVFRVEVSGPASFMLAPIMKMILNEELPQTVDRFVMLAENKN